MNNFAFDKTNYVLLAIGMAIIVVGLCLMAGSGSHEGFFNEAIFSVRRTRVAPVVCFVGFMWMTYGIMHKPREAKGQEGAGKK